jgi:hypothetical protein
MVKGQKGTHGGAGSGFSYDCPLCNKRHREGSPLWEKHLPYYEASLKKK